MIIRRAQPNDLTTIVAIFNESAHLPVNDESELISVASRRQWFTQFDDHHPLWVACQDQQVIGWCSLEPFYPHKAYRYSAEISIYVAKQAHRTGVGQKLLKNADKAAHKLNLHTIIAYIYQDNIASQRLFSKANYHHCGQLPEISNLNHRFHSLEIYYKNI